MMEKENNESARYKGSYKDCAVLVPGLPDTIVADVLSGFRHDLVE